MEAALKSKTKKVAAAALAAAMVATIAPAAGLSGAGAGEGVGVEAAYAATATAKLAAAADSAASKAPYAAQLAKEKVPGWDGASKVKVSDGSNTDNPIDLYSDGYDERGNYSADNGKTTKEVMAGCSGVTADGVRWAFAGGKTWQDENDGADFPTDGCGTLYFDCDGVYDPYTWSGGEYSGNGYDINVVTSDGSGVIDLLGIAKSVVVGKHVTGFAYDSFEANVCSDATMTFEEPSSFTKVASYAFLNCSIEGVVFPSSLKTLEKNAIYSGGLAMSGKISFKDPSNTVIAPGTIVRPAWMPESPVMKRAGKVKKIAAGKRCLTVSMKKVSGAKAYRVYYAVKGSSKYKSKLVKKLTSKNSTKSTVTCTVKGLKKGAQYKVHYIAYKKASAKKASAITRTPDKTSPKVK